MGKLLGIAYKEGKGQSMVEKSEIRVTVEAGLDGDYRGKPGNRQVTVFSKEGWEKACRIVSVDLHWSKRRANLFIEGVSFENSIGKFLKIGGLLLEITGETHPCNLMDKQKQGLQEALRPEFRGGVTCKVVEGALIALNDDVILVDTIE